MSERWRAGEIERGDFHVQATRLDARGIEQVAHQPVQAVGLFLDGLQPRAQRFLFKHSIWTCQCRGIATDDGNGRLQLVRDDRDKGLTLLLFLALACNVAHCQDTTNRLAPA